MSMQRRLGALLVVSALGAGLLVGCTSTGAPEATNGASLGVAAFESLAAQEGVQVIDVRTPGEYAEGHLAGAVNIDVRGAFASEITTLDPEGTYALYCRTGVRSGDAEQAMIDAGFTHVVDLDGGIVAWTQAGKPVVTD